MTVRQRLVFTIVGISVVLMIPTVYSVLTLNRVRDIASTQRLNHGAAYLAMGGLQARLAELDRLHRAYIITRDVEVHREMSAALDSAYRRLQDVRSAGYAEASRGVQQSVQRLREATAQIERLISDSLYQEAGDYFETVKPLFADAQGEIRNLYTFVDNRSQDDLNRARAISGGAMGTTAVVLLIGAAVAFLLGTWSTRMLTTPVMRLRDSMALVADGELRVPENLPYERQDEIGSVSRSFRAMTHRLADLDRLKAEFMSISTHELKTPINVISGYAELMQERVYGEVTEKQEEALMSIREQARVLAQLVNQLLDVSRLEAGGMRLHFHDVAVRDVLRRVERSFEGLAVKKNIRFEVHVNPSVPDTVPGDPDRLADQVLGNLLSNALKFTPEGGRIAVRSWLEDDRLAIEVEDSGPGIPRDQLPFIFDKYFQVGDQARSKGAGLGLAIAHEVVTAHGGIITAASEPGEGTSFRILLPTNGHIDPPAALAAPVGETAD
jgi:signal transduction histidine kinase